MNDAEDADKRIPIAADISERELATLSRNTERKKAYINNKMGRNR